MISPLRSILLLALLSGVAHARAQDSPKPAKKTDEPAKPTAPANPPQGAIPAPPVLEFRDEIKPLPPVAIPDDPPPHEGAFFDLPLTIEPPDIIIVEVLEGMPGRPITGERLVRPDGTINMGFYGNLYVRGLTPDQMKAKVVIHLRKWLTDEMLGLLKVELEGWEIELDEKAVPVSEGVGVPLPPKDPTDKKPESAPKGVESSPAKSDREAKPASNRGGRPSSRFSRRLGRSPNRPNRTTALGPQDVPKVKEAETGQEGKPNPGPEMVEVIRVEERWVVVPPAESSRVFVDIVSHNTKVYYVLGDVGVPGRLPHTGKETVLDALSYAGGMVPTAEPMDIHLYRPARGGKPAKDYKIDLEAIHRGVATANLQVFPDDRLVVGRNPIVKKTIEIDRAASTIHSLLGEMLQYSLTARSLSSINAPPGGGSGSGQIKVNGQNVPLNLADPVPMNAEQRDAMIKDWAEFLWSISSKEGGAMLDEKAFKEALMKKLMPNREPK